MQRWRGSLAAIACAVSVAAAVSSPASAGSIFGVYQDTTVGYPAVLAEFDSSGAISSNNIVGTYFGGGAVAPLQYNITGLAYDSGHVFGVFRNSDIGYPAVLADIDAATGNVLSTNIIGTYLGGGAIAPLQYSLSALTYGNGKLYGVFNNTDIGYPSVLATIDPSTGNVLSTDIIGTYFGGGSIAPLQYNVTGLAFGNGQLYGVYSNTDIGYPAVLAGIGSNGNVVSSDIIGTYFGGGSIAPLQYGITGLTFGDGHLYGVYQDSDIGYPAVLANFDTSGALVSTDIIGTYFGGGAVAPLQFPITGLAYLSTDTGGGGTSAVPEPATWAMMVGGLVLVGASTRRRKLSVSYT